MYQTFSEFSLDYMGTIRDLKGPKRMTAANRVVQFPFSVAVRIGPPRPLPPVFGSDRPALCRFGQLEKVKSEAEITAQLERRKESGRRLQEEAARKRVEKVHCPPLSGVPRLLHSFSPAVIAKTN